MANKYYGLNTTSLSYWLTSIRDALVDKYGDGVTINNITTSELVFTCPAISEKSIRFTTNYAYYGTVSGSTFTSENSFWYEFSSSLSKNKHLVLGDSFFFLNGTATYATLCLIAKTVNGVSLLCGATSAGDSYFSANNKFLAYKNGIMISSSIDFIDFGKAFYSDAGVPYKSQLLIMDVNAEGDNLLRKPDGTPDTINDLYMSSHAPTTPSLVVGGLFSDSSVYTLDVRCRLYTSLLAEF